VDEVRARARVELRYEIASMGREYKDDNSTGLHKFALDNVEGDEWPSDLSELADMPVPTMSHFDQVNMNHLLNMSGPDEGVSNLFKALLPTICAFNKKQHKLEWQMRQMSKSMFWLREQSTQTPRLHGKTPSFVSLLSVALQNYNPDVIPLALARHLREENKDQKEVRVQRDVVWGPDQHHWIVEGLT
jgi:hypothetical protein